MFSRFIYQIFFIQDFVCFIKDLTYYIIYLFLPLLLSTAEKNWKTENIKIFFFTF